MNSEKVWATNNKANCDTNVINEFLICNVLDWR